VSREIANRLTRIFLRDKSGRRAAYGGTEKFQTDPYWKDYVLLSNSAPEMLLVVWPSPCVHTNFCFG
jgi:hypothetical protein